MKILYIANIRLPTEKAHGVQIMKMCEAFAATGCEIVLVVTTRRSALQEDPFSYYGIAKNFTIVRLPTVDTVRFGRAGFLLESAVFSASALWYALTHRADIIFSRDESVLWSLSFFKNNLVWESHDGTWNVASRRIARRARGVVVVSQGLKDLYMGKGIAAKKIHIAPNGISLADFDVSETKEDARKRLGLPLDKKIAMYIGRLDGWKGTDTLLAASAYLPDSIRAVIIGGETSQIEALRKEYPDVIFLGYRPYRELPRNQIAADVLVVPNTGKNIISAQFTSPLKLVAHLAAGRPIVASDLPSIRELGADAIQYVPPDDPRALAQAIEEVCGDEGGVHALSAKARMRAALLNWNERTKSILSHIRSLSAIV